MRRLWTVTVSLKKAIPGGLATTMHQGYLVSHTEEQAIGYVVKKALEEHQGFGIDSVISMEVPPEHLACIVAEQSKNT
jgi:hypothetical protein